MEISGNINYDFIKSYTPDFFDKNPNLDFALMRKAITGTYPEKVTFSMTVPDSLISWISKKPSKIRCDLNKIAKRLDEYNLEVVPLTHTLLDEWYIGYKNFLHSIAHGIDRVDVQRIKNNIGEYLLVIGRDSLGSIRGGSILKNLDEKLSYSYAWYSDEFKKNGGSTACILKSIEYAISNGFETFSLGLDTNLYGGHLSFGLLHYKDSLMEPIKPNGVNMYKIFINPNTTKSFCYFIQSDKKLKKVIINKKV
jgi:hypothetical protein